MYHLIEYALHNVLECLLYLISHLFILIFVTSQNGKQNLNEAVWSNEQG